MFTTQICGNYHLGSVLQRIDIVLLDRVIVICYIVTLSLVTGISFEIVKAMCFILILFLINYFNKSTPLYSYYSNRKIFQTDSHRLLFQLAMNQNTDNGPTNFMLSFIQKFGPMKSTLICSMLAAEI